MTSTTTSTTTSPAPSPSLLGRLRSRTRRNGLDVELPEDHWHAGDPRVVNGTLALPAGDVPSPRAPVDQRRPGSAREVDVRDTAVLDLRPKAHGTGMLPVTQPAAPPRAPEPRESHETPAAAAPVTPAPPTEPAASPETSTWLG